MNTPAQSNPIINPTPLQECLIEHPEIHVVECYFLLEENEFHTLPYIAQLLKKAGFSAHEIAEAMKIYMES